jgi:N-acyl-D-aspartate/D-glutamate deacylase
MEGRTLGELIGESGQDAVDFVCDLLLAEDLAVSHVSAGWANEDDMIALLRHPAQMPGSDGLLLGSRVHPRTYGSFARVLQRYVREQRVLRLEEAIRKFSSFPAQRLGLADRGLIKAGLVADLVVFDEQAVAEQASPEAPRQLARGFSYVAVGGELVLEAGRHTGATPGRALRAGTGATGPDAAD